MNLLVTGLLRQGVKMYLPQKHSSVLSFNIPDFKADEIGLILSEDFDIAVRAGFHCAPLIHNLINTNETNGTVRVSLGYFNTEDDVIALVNAVREIMED